MMEKLEPTGVVGVEFRTAIPCPERHHQRHQPRQKQEEYHASCQVRCD